MGPSKDVPPKPAVLSSDACLFIFLSIHSYLLTGSYHCPYFSWIFIYAPVIWLTSLESECDEERGLSYLFIIMPSCPAQSLEGGSAQTCMPGTTLRAGSLSSRTALLLLVVAKGTREEGMCLTHFWLQGGWVLESTDFGLRKT